jgi:Tol biopolymer transport system component/cell wall-associated NlpC family hydrolase
MRHNSSTWKFGLIIFLGIIFLFWGGRVVAQESNPVRPGIAPEGASPNGWSYGTAISSDGRYLAFTSTADNLISNDNNLAADVFSFDHRSSTTTLVSISTRGNQGNAWSYQPDISADGRYVVFTSLANNLTGPFQERDTNGLADVFVRDQGTSTTQRISLRSDGSEVHGWSDQATISGDGRFIAFVSTAVDLGEFTSFTSSNVYVHDRQSRRTWSISHQPAIKGELTEAAHPEISTSGRYVTYIAVGNQGEKIAIHDIVTGETSFTPGIVNNPYELGNLSKPAISADGRTLAFLKSGSTGGQLFLYDQFTGKIAEYQIPPAHFGKTLHRPGVTISSNGNYITFESAVGVSIFNQASTHFEAVSSSTASPGINDLAMSGDGRNVVFSANKNLDIYLYNRGEIIIDVPPVTGWISDGYGHPLVGVTVKAGGGISTKTDQNGNFYFDELKSGHHDISPQKDGVTFNPSAYRVTQSADNPGLVFLAISEEIVPEARLDLGMPYALDRGCESPFEECGGPYHGFYRGDCTDLVMDAYREGIDFDIQSALMYDFYINPRHYYRWHNARNSHDMYRYFSYTRQLMPHNVPYLAGDIVFFDWEANGVVDHVAIVSEVTNKNQPRKLIDATGFIDENPNGSAIELDWQQYHDLQTIGHARWTGLYSFKDGESPKDIPILLVALDSTAATVQVYDIHDRAVSASAQDMEGSRYLSTGVGEVISIDDPMGNSDMYLVEITGSKDGFYSLGVQTIDSGVLNKAYSYEGNITAGESVLLPLFLIIEDEKLNFNIQTPSP